MPLLIRHRMSLDLATLRGPALLPEGYRAEPITVADIDALAVLEVESYRGTTDWELVPSLQTVEGCRAFIEDLLSGEELFAGKQGRFRADLSYKLISPDGLCGACYSLFNSDTAYIIDFSVAPGSRGKGRGTSFLAHILRCYRDERYSHAVLFVTQSNLPAMRLYAGMGFTINQTFEEQVGLGN